MAAKTSTHGSVIYPREDPIILTEIQYKNKNLMIVKWNGPEIKLRTEEVVKKWPDAVLKFYDSTPTVHWNITGVSQSQVLKVTTIK